MKNVVITGATSFIGIHIINQYLNNNCRVIAVVRPDSPKLNRLPQNVLLTVLEISMEEIEKIIDLIGIGKFDTFYHLAWEGTRLPYRDDVAIQNANYNATIKAMKIARLLGCDTFIGAGSQAEYGKCIGKIDECHKTNPTTEYGKAKLKTYEALNIMAKENNIKFIWARLFSVYGIYDNEETLVMSALEKMKKNENIRLTECSQKWDFVNVKDVARAMYLFANTACMDGIYNIASGESRQLKEYLLEMREISGSTSELKFGAIPYSSEGRISFEPIIDKLKQNLRWSCGIKFGDGIRQIIEFKAMLSNDSRSTEEQGGIQEYD